MLEALFGSRRVEEALFYLVVNDRCYATELQKRFSSSLSPFQGALDRLEQGGVLVSRLVGKTRMYEFNPRYPFLRELIKLLEHAYPFLPEELRQRYYEPAARQRPRKRGKRL
jgi:hypothetical protein